MRKTIFIELSISCLCQFAFHVCVTMCVFKQNINEICWFVKNLPLFDTLLEAFWKKEICLDTHDNYSSRRQCVDFPLVYQV